MRVNPKNTDYEAISRRSIQKDFQKQRIYPEKNKSPQIQNSKKTTKRDGVRIKEVSERCEYVRFAKYLVGRLMKRVDVRENSTSGWYEFVFDDDRKALNNAAGWSDNKKRYLLTSPKLKTYE